MSKKKRIGWVEIERQFREILGEDLNPWIDGFISDKGGPWRESIADLLFALRELKPDEREPFIAWTESRGTWWYPGYGVHPPEDAVLCFRIDRDLAKTTSLH